MKYKVGDKVRVRSDLKTGNAYGIMIFTRIMENLTGKVATIKEVKDISYLLEENEKPWWTDEMFEGLAEEKPTPKFKVGDRVKIVGANIKTKEKYIGEVVTIEILNPNKVKNLKNFPYGVEENGKNVFVWFEDELQLYTEPEPIQVNVNINININYDNACWYCRKGGVVDLYFKGQPGICPHCGRVCNVTEEVTKSHKPVKPVKKENRPLTTKELEALPDGTRVFTVWVEDGVEMFEDDCTRWRIKRGDRLNRETDDGWIGIWENTEWYNAYLEEPEKLLPF